MANMQTTEQKEAPLDAYDAYVVLWDSVEACQSHADKAGHYTAIGVVMHRAAAAMQMYLWELERQIENAR